MRASSRRSWRRHCTEKLGVRHVLADIVQVNQRESGDIEGVLTRQAGEILGDLFIDCSGFAALLHRQDPRRRLQGVRRCSILRYGARRCRCRSMTPDAPMASQTNATAHEAGWTWDICLPTRRGVGLCLLEPPPERRGGARDAAAVHRRAAQGPAGAQDSDPRRPSRDLLEEQLRRGRARQRLSRAARVLGHRSGRALRQAHRRADAGVPGGDGHRRAALQ